MLRRILSLAGLAVMATGLLMAPSPVRAEDPPQFVTKFLVNQRVPALPDGPLCWNIVRQTIPPGGRVPAQGFRAYPLTLAAITEGQIRLDYSGGPTLTMNASEGAFIGNDNWFSLTNSGTGNASAVLYTLSCQTAPAGVPGLTQLANSGPLDGIRPGAYDVTFVEVTGVTGSAIAAHTHPSTESAFMLEGALALSTPAGIREYHAGEMVVVPFGVTHAGTMVSATPGRLVSAYLVPAGQQIRDFALGVRLPMPASATPAALPRTGTRLPWASLVTMVAGAVMTVAGIAVRRRA